MPTKPARHLCSNVRLCSLEGESRRRHHPHLKTPPPPRSIIDVFPYLVYRSSIVFKFETQRHTPSRRLQQTSTKVLTLRVHAPALLLLLLLCSIFVFIYMRANDFRQNHWEKDLCSSENAVKIVCVGGTTDYINQVWFSSLRRCLYRKHQTQVVLDNSP